MVAFKKIVLAENFVQLSGNAPPIWNGGDSCAVLAGPIQIHGNLADPPDIGLCLSRKWVQMDPTPMQPNGFRILHSVHVNAVRDVYITGKFKLFGVLILGAEDAVAENVCVDADCGVAGWCESSVDAWGLEQKFGIPGGTTCSGGTRLGCKVASFHGPTTTNADGTIKPGSDCILCCGTVTDIRWNNVTTAGHGDARFRFHTMPGYSYRLPDGTNGFTDARPNRIKIVGADVNEGSFQYPHHETRQAPAQAFAANISIDNGAWANWTAIEQTKPLAVALPPAPPPSV